VSDNKKYYWLKLKDDFFRDKEIKKLRKIAGGDTYTIIYLKLQLLSLKNEGKLFFENLEDTFAEEMALEIDEDTENVKITILYLRKCGLLEETNENEFMLPQAVKSIGNETQGAERVRRFRENKKMLLGNADVTKCNTEIRDKREEIEKEIEINIIPFKEIIEHLNINAGTSYKASGNKTRDLITARWNEGFTLEEFKKVINKKCIEWIGSDYEKFLVPTTLFGTKFEGYLNQKGSVNNGTDAKQDKGESKTQYDFSRFY